MLILRAMDLIIPGAVWRSGCEDMVMINLFTMMDQFYRVGFVLLDVELASLPLARNRPRRRDPGC